MNIANGRGTASEWRRRGNDGASIQSPCLASTAYGPAAGRKQAGVRVGSRWWWTRIYGSKCGPDDIRSAWGQGRLVVVVAVFVVCCYCRQSTRALRRQDGPDVVQCRLANLSLQLWSDSCHQRVDGRSWPLAVNAIRVRGRCGCKRQRHGWQWHAHNAAVGVGSKEEGEIAGSTARAWTRWDGMGRVVPGDGTVGMGEAIL